ncbi:MAG: dTDP-4-dehydrorhamnose 3,5-epimerase [Elusimicrobia bacterium GWD2_63_28]|nr:MAG: dTDP-4-dehydrorhamnose 3,5-epimerase [Elusimicrobia bacterium GWD2_63_28]
MKFVFKKTAIQGLLVIKPEARGDERGAAAEIYKASEFRKAGIKETFVQENRSVSRKGVLRGLHYQRAPQAQARLVRCGRGRAFCVAVDLRPKSKTYGRSYGLELSGDNWLMLYAPAGFAHGFCALTDGTEVTYLCSKEFSEAHYAGLRWNDPALKINWPIKRPKVSPKDAALQSIEASPR